jgi:galactokinase
MNTPLLPHYTAHFNTPPEILLQSPGRINLIGEHTDYNLGRVFPAAIDKYLYFAMSRNEQPEQVRFHAIDIPEETTFSAQITSVSETASWAKYLQAVVVELNRRGYPVRGIDGVFGGDIPMGAGLSSSAALCCGFIYGISQLQNMPIPKREIAGIAQAAEHRIGLNCGLMDQYAVLFGKKDTAICLDCKSLEFEHIPLNTGAYSLVLLNSNIKHELAAGSGYNDRRRSCENVVSTIQQEHPYVQSLRDVSFSMLETFRQRLDPVDHRRARYVLRENERVLQTRSALQNGDMQQVGQILYDAHEGMRTEYEITVPELDLLVELAHAEPGVLGARMVGGGFGGCTLNLIKTSEKELILPRMMAAYQQKTGIQPTMIEVKTADGVRMV